MEAELYACLEATAHAIWLKNFITCLKIVDSIERPLQLYCDNQSVVCFANNNKSSSSCKYLDLKLYVVNERVENQIVSIDYISTQSMLADPFTKGLAPGLYSVHVKNMGLSGSFSMY